MSRKPDYQRDGITLYCGDCLQILPELSGVDAVVTDPPFGIGFKYESHDDTPDGYGAFLWDRIAAAESLCLPGSPVFVWQTMLNVRKFCEWFPREWRIFAACKNFVQMRPTAMQYSFDPVVVWWTEGEVWSKGTANRDWHVGDTTPRSKCDDDYVAGHPCPRPLFQVQHIISQWVRPESVAIDPFMGSGTTGVACVRTGRKFIGIELDPTYFAIAVKRIDAALDTDRDSLWSAKELAAETQPSLFGDDG